MKKVYNNLARMIENARYWHARNVFKKRYLKALSLNGILNQYVDGENEWLKKWRQLDPHITPLQYRLFSHYIGANINIVPEEISHFLIEPFLNSKSMAAYYSDKNMFDKILPSSYLPKTILRKINGTFYDPMYQYQEPTDDIVNKLFDLSGCERCIIKPSVGGESGKGVQLFQKSEMGWRNIKTNELLSAEYLIHSVGDNIIVQKAVCQHDYINHFNKTSVNTLRLAVYRSVKDNQCHVLGAIMRIGAIGSVVDNAHMGGYLLE